LPVDYLARCRDTGEAPAAAAAPDTANAVNCGGTECGAGQKCCVSLPGLPACVDADEPCRCTPVPAGDDGGVDDAGR
jgi:hypothetical protein